MRNSNTTVIEALTGYTADEQAKMIFERGVAYAESEMGTGYFTQLMLESPDYWHWWKEQWSKMDQSFLDETYSIELITDQDVMKSEYDILHSAANIQYGPTSPILQESYLRFAHQLMKEVRRG
jgi:hypothetical protein